VSQFRRLAVDICDFTSASVEENLQTRKAKLTKSDPALFFVVNQWCRTCRTVFGFKFWLRSFFRPFVRKLISIIFFFFFFLVFSLYLSRFPPVSHNVNRKVNFEIRVHITDASSSVSIVTRQRIDFRQGQGFFSSPPPPYRLWGPPSLLFSGYRGSFLGGKAAGA
jgi:hypothetical protein